MGSIAVVVGRPSGSRPSGLSQVASSLFISAEVRPALEGRELAVTRDPRLADDFVASLEHILNEGAADVAAINVQLGDDVAAGQVGNVIAQDGGRFFFRTIRGCQGAREDQVAVEVGGNVTLVAVEPLALALSAVAHLTVFDRNATLRGNALADARACTGRIRLEVLPADLAQRSEVTG